VGGSVAAFRLAGRPIFRESPPDLHDAGDSASFPLVPFSNRVRDGRFSFRGREIRLAPNMAPQKHPLHGQGWRGAWSVEQAEVARAVLGFTHGPGEWPWAYQARQEFALDAAGLIMRLELTNTDAEPMPCGLGLHPYFPADADTVLDTEVRQVWTIDDEIMPVALEPAAGRYDLSRRRINGADLDNGYEGWGGRAELRWPGLTMRLLSPQASRFQVYSPREGGVVVIEPVTHANAAFNHPEDRWAALGLIVLKPGQTTSLEARFEVERTGAGASA
jgi:aldose 1-epimerase